MLEHNEITGYAAFTDEGLTEFATIEDATAAGFAEHNLLPIVHLPEVIEYEHA